MTLDGFTPIPDDFAATYRAEGYWRDTTIGEELDAACERHASRVALVDADRSVTYAELKQQAHRLARHLLDMRIKPLDRMIIQIPNTIEFVPFYYATQLVGAIPLLALPAHRRFEIEHYVQFTDAKLYAGPTRLGSFDFAEMIGPIREANECLEHVLLLGDDVPADSISIEGLLSTEPTSTEADLAAIVIDPDAPALFQLSGGTTGVPKMIARTHNDYVYNSYMSLEPYRTGEDDVLLVCLPIAHNFPLACPGVQGYLFAGATSVIAPSPKPEQCFELIERFGVTHLELVPAVLISWLHHDGFQPDVFASVRVINTGGQRLQPEVKRDVEARLPTTAMCEIFGMAEGLLTWVLEDDPDDVRHDTIGRPWCPHDETVLVDDNGDEVPDGEIGELICRGPYTLRGYFKADEHNARTFTADGFFMTGDLMRRHPSGSFIVEGRRKDVINRGGEKIGVEEIENFLVGMEAVQNIACVPMPDPILGERMCAYVIPEPGHTPTLADLTDHLKAQGLSKMKLPERLELVEEFPLSPFGKVSKKDLGARIAEIVERENVTT